MENKVRERDEERDGLGGVRGSSEGPWRWWPAVVVEDDEPLLLFDDSVIW